MSNKEKCDAWWSSMIEEEKRLIINIFFPELRYIEPTQTKVFEMYLKINNQHLNEH